MEYYNFDLILREWYSAVYPTKGRLTKDELIRTFRTKDNYYSILSAPMYFEYLGNIQTLNLATTPHKPVRDLFEWTGKNIIAPMSHDSWLTGDVKMRVMTGMLNKLESQGHISSCISTTMFYNFVRNIRYMRTYIQNLPF